MDVVEIAIKFADGSVRAYKLDNKPVGNELTPEQIAAGEIFTKLVDERGGLDKLTDEDKEKIRAAGGTV